MTSDFSIAVFPYLKITAPVSFGNYDFRSTKDTDGLSEVQAKAVQEIASMLFLKDDLQIDVASYAITPYIDINEPPDWLVDMRNIQTVIAYLYGNAFLSSEHASLVVFSQGLVPKSLVERSFNTIVIGDANALQSEAEMMIMGYSGIFNFQHHFWVKSGSRIYGPAPHLTMNRDQNLSRTVEQIYRSKPHHKILVQLLKSPATEFARRIFIAIRWYNSSNLEANDENTSLVHLAIAFEALLQLPAGEKTERLVDSISLLLGRFPRLEIWARQFYNARSEIVHEGSSIRLRFLATDKRKDSSDELYQPLLLYGQRIFRLCLATLLYGAELAREEQLEEEFKTNHQRYEKICRILSDEKVSASKKLDEIVETVELIRRYQFLWEQNLQIATMIGALKLAANTLLDNDPTLSLNTRLAIEHFANSNRSKDHFQELSALQNLEKELPYDLTEIADNEVQTVAKLVDVSWSYLYMHYYWLSQQRAESEEE